MEATVRIRTLHLCRTQAPIIDSAVSPSAPTTNLVHISAPWEGLPPQPSSKCPRTEQRKVQVAGEPHGTSELTMGSVGKKNTQCHPGDCRAWSVSWVKVMNGSSGRECEQYSQLLKASQTTKTLHTQEVRGRAGPSGRRCCSRVERRGTQEEQPGAGYAADLGVHRQETKPYNEQNCHSGFHDITEDSN